MTSRPSRGPRHVLFVYRASQLRHGSTTMRVHQLCEQVVPHLPDSLIAGIRALPSPKLPLFQHLWASRQPEGAFIIFSKNALRKLLPETLRRLKRRGCCICFDYVDADLRGMPLTGVDVHLAASVSAERELRALQAAARQRGEPVEGSVRLLHHNVDSRVLTIGAATSDQFGAVYFGSAAKTIIPQDLRVHLEILETDSRMPDRIPVSDLAGYSFHYCISAPPSRWQSVPGEIVRRPFTKGFTAAALAAAVLVNDTADDAEELLGSDYPFLVRGDSETAITEGFEAARQSFGGPDWVRATAAVADLRRHFEPRALARSLAGIVSSFDA